MTGQTIHLGLKIDADISSAKVSLNQLHQELNKMQTQNFELGGMDKSFKEAADAAKQLQTHLFNATNKFGQIDMGKFSQSMKASNTSVKQLSTAFLNAGKQGQAAFSGLANQIINAQKPALSFSNILTKMGTTLMNNIRWQLSSTMINGFTQGIREAWTYTKNMDEALTNIRVVTGKSREEMDRLAESANKMAKNLKTSTNEIVKGQLIFYQQGDSAALAAEKARITTMAANVSFNSSQEEMAEYLTAIWNSYQVGEDQLELFIDKLSAVGAATATSMEEIATAMTKVAASANAVGVTYDQLNATIATISSTTRTSAESVGTAMKTIYARMGDLKVGKADEDGITYGQVSSTMKRMGIDIADANGQLRDMGEVVEEIGGKWKTFSNEEQTALVQAIAGKRQYTNLTALFENWDEYLEALDTSKNAMGTLQEQQEIWADSWEGASNRVKASLEGLWQHSLDSDVFIGGANALASFVDFLDKAIESAGGLSSVLLAIGGILTNVFNRQITNMFAAGVNNVRIMFGGWQKEIERMRIDLANLPKEYPGFANLSRELQNAVKDFAELAAVENVYMKNQSKMSSGQKATYDFHKRNVENLQKERHELEESIATNEKYLKSLDKSKITSFKQGREGINLDRNQIVKQAFGGDHVKASTFLGLPENQISSMNGKVGELRDSLKKIAGHYEIDLGLADDEQDAKKVRDALNQLLRELKIPIPDMHFNLMDDIQITKNALDGFVQNLGKLGSDGTVAGSTVKQAFSTLGQTLNLTKEQMNTLLDGMNLDADDAKFSLDQIGQIIQNVIAMKANLAGTHLDLEDDELTVERILQLFQGIAGAGVEIKLKTEGIRISLDNMKTSATSTKNSFTGVTSALMSAASAGMSLSSSFDSFTNGDIAGGLMGIMSAVMGIAMAFIAVNAAMGWVSVAITLLIAGISLWQKYHKSAKEKIQDLNSEIETLQGEIESLNGELETTQDRISELQNKGTLSLVEQEELERLLQQEASLERQIRLKEDLEKRKTVEKNKTWLEDEKEKEKGSNSAEIVVDEQGQYWERRGSTGGPNSTGYYYIKTSSDEAIKHYEEEVKELQESGVEYIENATSPTEKDINARILEKYTNLYKAMADGARASGDLEGYADYIADIINEQIMHDPDLENFSINFAEALKVDPELLKKNVDDLPDSIKPGIQKFIDMGIITEDNWADVINNFNNGILSLNADDFTKNLDWMAETTKKKITQIKDVIDTFDKKEGFTNEERSSILEAFPSLTPEELAEYEEQLKSGEMVLDEFYNKLKNKDFDNIKFNLKFETEGDIDDVNFDWSSIQETYALTDDQLNNIKEQYKSIIAVGSDYGKVMEILNSETFDHYELTKDGLTFYDKEGKALKTLTGEFQDLANIFNFLEGKIDIDDGLIDTKEINDDIKKLKELKKELKNIGLKSGKPITEEQRQKVIDLFPELSEDEINLYLNQLEKGYLKLDEFYNKLKNKKFDKIKYTFDIEVAANWTDESWKNLAKEYEIPEEEINKLKVAYQELADEGIAYAATTADGSIAFFNELGEEVELDAKVVDIATAKMIALNNALTPFEALSKRGLSQELYSNIVNIGAASGWSKVQINGILEAATLVQNKNLSFSQQIGALQQYAAQAGTTAGAILSLIGITIKTKEEPVPESERVGGAWADMMRVTGNSRVIDTKITTVAEYDGVEYTDLSKAYSVAWKKFSSNFSFSGGSQYSGSPPPATTKPGEITDGTTGNGGDSGKEEDPQWKKDYEEAIATIEHEAEMLGTAAEDVYAKRKAAFETALSEAKKAGQHTEYLDDFQGWSEDLKNSYADILSEEEKDWDYAIKTGQKTFAEIEKDFLELLNGKILDENGKEIDAYTAPEKKELKEEFYSDWNRFFDTIKEGYEDAKYSAKDALSEMWKIANDTSFSEYERNQMRKEIRSYGEELISNLPDDLEKGAITWEKAIENFGDIVTNTWGIVLKNMTREQFLQLPEEQRTAIQDSALGILDAIETAWNNNELDFSEGIKWRDEFLKENASAFSDVDKAIYSNNENWIEKYLSSQQSLYEKGAISAEKFRNNLLTAAEAFPEHAALITKAYEDTLQVINSIQKKYSNLIAQQEIIDWGMHTKYNLGNVAEYKLPYAQQQYDELMAYKSWYEAMNPSTDLVNDETYQSIISSIKSAQDTLQDLADEHIQFSLDWISHEESMNRLTYEDKVAAYDRILKKIESGYYRQMFTNEEDYINWQKKQNANLRQSKIDAAQAEAQLYADILKEELEDEKAYYENLKSIREKEFDASQTIRESQHELNMELQKSLTMYEYLDEETRKLIFNEEDYVALTKELSSIQTEINDLTSTYESKIASATTEEAELLTAEYEAQVELKLKEFEIAKSNLEIAKKQMALQNTLNERNTRMFINGQWTWVANQEEVAKAREELAEAEFNAETATLEREHQQAMGQLDNAIGDIQREVNEIDEVLEDLEETLNGEKGLIVTFNKLNEAAGKAIDAYENQEDLLDSGWSDYNDLPTAEKSFLSKLNKASEEISNGKENVNIEFVQKVWNNKTGQFDYEKHTLSRANAKSKWVLDGEFELTDEAFENYKESAINRKDKELVLNTELNKDNIYEFGGKKYKYDQEKEQWVNIYNPDKEMTIDEQEELIENLMDNGIAVDDFEELSVSIDASTNAITSDTGTIIDLLTTIILMDKETRDAYLNTLKNAKEGDEFTLGPKTFIKEDNGWRDINDKSDNPILYSIEDIINGIYYKQNPNAKAEDEAYAAKYDNYKKVHFSTSGVAQADDVWWSSESPDKHGQSDEAKALIDAGIITDQGWFQDSVKQAQYYKKKIAEYLPEDIANKLFSAVDTKYLGEAFAASYYKNLYEGIVAVTKDGRQSEWVDIAAASYNGDFYNDMGWLLNTDSAAAKSQLENLDLIKNKEAIESITKTSEDVTNAAIEYIVVSGDNLSAIAKKYGVTVDEILAANPDIKNPNLINIGQKIKIPGKGTTTTTSNKKTATTTKTNTSNTYSSTEAALWASLKAAGYSDEAAAAIMGNIYHESGIRANNVQDEMGWTDAGYLQAVKNGSHDFINDNIGWGLAQWTDPTRKKALLDYLNKRGMSIDNVQGQIEFLILELAQKGFSPEILNALGFNDASNKILFKYENPLDQSASVQRVRQSTGSKYLNKYGGDKYLSYQTDGSGEKVTSTVTTDGTGKPQTTTFTSPSNNITINQSLVLPEALINTLQFILEEIYKITAIIHGDGDGFLKVHDGTLLYEQEMDLVACTEKIVESIKNIKISAPLSSEETPEFNARGNIINRPTLSWVGEDGPEAIIPLSPKYRDRGLSLWEEATKALGIAPSLSMPTIRASFPQQKENMNVSQTINVTVQNEDSSNDFYAITNLL